MLSTTELRPRAISIGGGHSEPLTPRSFAPLSPAETRDTGPRNWFDNFRRANNPSPESFNTTTHGVYNERRAAVQTARTALVRKLKSRHLQMIAIGGSIGSSFLVLSDLRLSIIYLHRLQDSRAETCFFCRHRFVDWDRQCPRHGGTRLGSHCLYYRRCRLVLYHAGDGGDGESSTCAGPRDREMQTD